MKKFLLSAMAGALSTILILMAAVRISEKPSPKEYSHIDYVSSITQDTCFVCSNASLPYWGRDNIGLVNLNTFEILHLEINRYDDSGKLIEEPAGVLSSNSMIDADEETYVHAYVDSDRAYAHLQLTGVKYEIDRESIECHLCQICLDSINSLWSTTQPPAEFAVISFADRTIQPLLNAYPWFSAGNFGVDCEFKPDGAIGLLVHYCPNRYAK